MSNRMQGRIDFSIPYEAITPNAEPVELAERIAALVRAEMGPSCVTVKVPSFGWPPGRLMNCEGFALVEWQLSLQAMKPDRSDDDVFSAAVLDRIDALLDGAQRRIDGLWADGRALQEYEDAKERLGSFLFLPSNTRTLVKMARRALEPFDAWETRPLRSGWYAVKWCVSDPPEVVLVYVGKDGTSWSYGHGDDPQSIEIDRLEDESWKYLEPGPAWMYRTEGNKP